MLAIATSDLTPGGHADDLALAAALRARGIATDVVRWNAADVDWSRYASVLPRSTWDYFMQEEAFRAWLDRLEGNGIRTINATGIVRWNMDKRYLVDLQVLGVAIVPTRIGGKAQLLEMAGFWEDRAVVIKPSVSGTAWHTIRGTLQDPEFLARIDALPDGLQYLVQPFLPEIATAGEWSLVYIDGTFSHSALKLPRAGDYRVQGEHGGTMVMTAPPESVLHAADRCIAAFAAQHGSELAYARVDLVEVEGEPLLMELELVEPLLYLSQHPAAVERLADGIARASGLDQAPVR